VSKAWTDRDDKIHMDVLEGARQWANRALAAESRVAALQAQLEQAEGQWIYRHHLDTAARIMDEALENKGENNGT
jgi:hypothetical protein